MTTGGARKWACALVMPMFLPAASDSTREDPLLEGYIHTKWTHKDGLPATDVRKIVQTPDGYLWLDTSRGLIRFDGVNFRLFASFPGLPHTGGTALCVAADGSLWFGLVDGGVVNLKHGKTTVYPPGNGLAGSQVRTLRRQASRLTPSSVLPETAPFPTSSGRKPPPHAPRENWGESSAFIWSGGNPTGVH